MANGGKGGAGGAGAPNVFSQAATAYNSSLGATGAAFDKFAGLGGYTPATAGPAAGYTAATVAAPNTVASGIDTYMNPYQSSVMDYAAQEIEKARAMQTGQIGDAALAAGAFGGSRHGLVEAETNEGALRETGRIAGQLGLDGFKTAAGLSATDIANTTGVNMANAGAADTAAAFGAAGRNQFSLADQIARNEAARFAGTQAATGANGMLAAGGQAGGLAASGVGIGQSVNNQNLAYGGIQQQQMQQIIDAARGMFGGFVGQGQTLLDLIGSSLSGSPLNNATTTTQQYKPGLFDYLSLAAQTGASVYNPTPKPIT